MSPPPDAFDAIVKIGGWALSALVLGACSLILKAHAGLKATLESERRARETFEKEATKKEHEIELKLSKMEAFAGWATSEIGALKADNLPREYFKLATRSQNDAVNSQSDALKEIRRDQLAIKEKLHDLDKSKPSRSEMNMLAARQPEPVRPGARRDSPPIRRSDGPSTPPPPEPEFDIVRAKLPSMTTEH